MKLFAGLFSMAALLFAGCASLEADQSTIRVMTYNIHHAEGIDGKVDLERIAALIKRERAEVVALQEVDRGVERTARRDLPAELAKLTGMNVYFSRNIIHQGGDYGNAVLSRFPIRQSTNTHFRMLREGEQRGVVQLILDVHGKKILFMNTHLDHRPDDAERLINADELKQIVMAAGKIPVILCGDFNTSPSSPTHRKIESFLSDSWKKAGEGNGFTIPSEKPHARIDYIWVNELVQPLTMKVLQSEASDHLPVIGEYKLTN